MAGESLAQRLQRGSIPLREVLKLGIEICEGLEAAHSGAIIRHDLKPGNIMLTKTGAKLMDFGLPRAVESKVILSADSAPLLSAARTITAAGLSPLTTQCAQTL